MAPWGLRSRLAAAAFLCGISVLGLLFVKFSEDETRVSQPMIRRRLQEASERWFRSTKGPCKHAFIDLGANVGDVLASMANAARQDMTSIGMRFDPQKAQWKDVGVGKNLETKMERLFSAYMTKLSAEIGDMCVVGIEGNPVFTKQLKALETALRTEVVDTVDIATESVISNENGKTTLFLDTINPDKNYWGSSIADSSVNVICGEDAKSKFWDMFKGKHFYDKAEKVDCEKAKADVDSVKLSTLIRTYLSEDAIKSGDSLLIVKMDVEGAEYLVFDDIVASEVACGYTGLGNHMVIIYEEHRNSLQGAFQEYRGPKYKENLRKLESCGVKIYEGERLASIGSS